jgi:vitamin B12/bleomycin/antimicrobial peptide transport system ATP-binding/permease protein
MTKVNRQLWNKFLAIAQPYFYPTDQPRQGAVFMTLLLLLIMFLFGSMFVLVSGVSLGLQALFPESFGNIAGGLVKAITAIISSPWILVVAALLLIPLAAAVLFRRQLLPRWQPWMFLSVVLLLILCVSGMNVVISYVGNFFTTALAKKQPTEFWRFFWVYAGVFAIATPFTVYSQYFQDLLGLRWRQWLTEKFLGQYFDNQSYYKINLADNIDNPDQRIAQDIFNFTDKSLFFLVMILASLIDVFAFTGILWSISQFLAIFLVGYALLGTVVIAVLGQKLITLNFSQLKLEANFRYGLVHVRDNAESIAFYRGETQELGQVSQRFWDAIRNFKFLIGWQRNLGFLRVPYRYATYILPSVILAPLYFQSKIEFGDMTQAGFAFSQIFEAFALVVLQINTLAEFAAGIDRLGTFTDVLEESGKPTAIGTTQIDAVEDSRIALEHVTLQVPKYDRTLVKDLSVALDSGDGLVIVGHSGVGKSSVLRAIAGLWNAGTGKITRPQPEQMLFLPQRPYMILGSLRDQLLYPHTDSSTPEAELQRVLELVNLESLPDRVGGFDVELDWADVLSLGEQQRLAVARLLLTRPPYAILDEATSALDLKNEQLVYEQIQATTSAFISVGHRPSLLKYHQHVLELKDDGNWELTSSQDYVPKAEVFS